MQGERGPCWEQLSPTNRSHYCNTSSSCRCQLYLFTAHSPTIFQHQLFFSLHRTGLMNDMDPFKLCRGEHLNRCFIKLNLNSSRNGGRCKQDCLQGAASWTGLIQAAVHGRLINTRLTRCTTRTTALLFCSRHEQKRPSSNIVQDRIDSDAKVYMTNIKRNVCEALVF